MLRSLTCLLRSCWHGTLRVPDSRPIDNDRKHRFPALRSSTVTFVNVLRLIWILAFIHSEFAIFWKAARHCAPWPGNTDSSDEQVLDRLLLVGDPQMTDAYSYDRSGVLLYISEFYSDLYMGRNYRHLQRQLRPKGTLFMGDLMDGGREWDDAGFVKQASRFRHLFRSEQPQYFMAGNHDIGFGDGVQERVVNRFKDEYGATSYTLDTGTPYSIVVVDSISLSARHTDLTSKQLAWDMLERHLPPQPRILLTHVPLYRSLGTSCGPDRQGRSREIRQGRGYQYQNMIDSDLSRQLLGRVAPTIVFSGDDHDYCLIKHQQDTDGDGIPEITIPTFNMAQGVRHPGVVLLDLSVTSDDQQAVLATKLCWLPDQITIFIAYGWLAALSLASLAIVHAHGWTTHRSRRAFGTSNDSEDTLPIPATTAASSSLKTSTGRRLLAMLLRDVADVASTSILAYIVCLITL